MATVFKENFQAESHSAPEDVLLIVEVSDSTLKYNYEVKNALRQSWN